MSSVTPSEAAAPTAHENDVNDNTSRSDSSWQDAHPFLSTPSHHRGRKAANTLLLSDERRRQRVLKNRQSALKSLQKKKKYTEELELRAKALQARNAELKVKVRILMDHLALPIPPHVVLTNPLPASAAVPPNSNLVGFSIPPAILNTNINKTAIDNRCDVPLTPTAPALWAIGNLEGQNRVIGNLEGQTSPTQQPLQQEQQIVLEPNLDLLDGDVESGDGILLVHDEHETIDTTNNYDDIQTNKTLVLNSLSSVAADPELILADLVFPGILPSSLHSSYLESSGASLACSDPSTYRNG